MSEKDLKSVFEQYYPMLCAFASKYIDDRDDAKDVVQQVFINLWDKWESLDHSESIKPYLFRSVTNRSLNYLRDKKRIVHVNLPADDSEVSNYLENTDFLEVNELKIKIADAINQLPEKTRKVFLLSRHDNKSYKEIAELLGVTVKAIEAHMTKALKQLKNDLVDYLQIILLIKLGYNTFIVCVG